MVLAWPKWVVAIDLGSSGFPSEPSRWPSSVKNTAVCTLDSN